MVFVGWNEGTKSTKTSTPPYQMGETGAWSVGAGYSTRARVEWNFLFERQLARASETRFEGLR